MPQQSIGTTMVMCNGSEMGVENMRLRGRGTQQKAVTAGGQRSLAGVHNCLGLGRQSLKFEIPQVRRFNKYFQFSTKTTEELHP